MWEAPAHWDKCCYLGVPFVLGLAYTISLPLGALFPSHTPKFFHWVWGATGPASSWVGGQRSGHCKPPWEAKASTVPRAWKEEGLCQWSQCDGSAWEGECCIPHTLSADLASKYLLWTCFPADVYCVLFKCQVLSPQQPLNQVTFKKARTREYTILFSRFCTNLSEVFPD